MLADAGQGQKATPFKDPKQLALMKALGQPWPRTQTAAMPATR